MTCSVLWDSVNTTSFLCQCSVAKITVNNFEINCEQTIDDFGFIQLYDGSTADAIVSDYIQFIVDVSDGTIATADLLYASINNITTNIYYGDNVNFSASMYPSIPTQVYYGEATAFELTQRFNPSMVINSYYGEMSSTALSVSSIFSPKPYYGEIATFELTKALVANINPNVYDGSSGVCDISTEVNFSNNNVSYGENVVPKMAVSYGFSPYVYYGESVDCTFSNNPPFTITTIVSYGEVVTASVQKESMLFPLIYHGASVSFELEQHLPEAITTNVYHGTSVNFDIFKTTYIPVTISDGSVMESTLDYRIGFRPTFNISDGHICSIDSLALTRSLGPVDVKDGVGLHLVDFDFLPNDYIYYGDNLSFNLALQATFDSTVIDGSSLTTDIRVAPSEPLSDEINFLDGNSVTSEIKEQRAYQFKFHISHGTEMVITTYKSLFVDLDRVDKYIPLLSDMLYIDLDRNSNTGAFFGNKCRIRVDAVFCTLPTFKFDAYDGNVLDPTGNTWNMTFNVNTGESVSTRDLYNELFIDMSYGNLVPSGDFVKVELNRPPLVIPQLIQMCSGENVNFKLRVEKAFPLKAYFGEILTSVLSTRDMKIPVEIWHGQYVTADLGYDPMITIEMYTGESIDYKFEEPLPYTLTYGETMTLSGLNIQKDVVLTKGEETCLLNSYLSVSPTTGQPIHTESEIMAVEGKPFSQYITGGCF